MNKLHLGDVILTILVVGMVVVAVGTGGWNMTDTETPAGSSAGSQPDDAGSVAGDSDDANSMSVKSVSVRDRTPEGVVYLNIAVAGELDMEQLESSVKRLYDDPSVNVSTIELVNVQQNVATDGNTSDGKTFDGDSSNDDAKEPGPDASVRQNDAADGNTRGPESDTSDERNDAADGTHGSEPDTSDERSVVTVAIVTDDRSNTTHVVKRVEHYLSDENLAEQSAQRTEQTDDSAAEYTVVSDGRVCKVRTAHYQVDFVVGEPIEQLHGPEGTYLPHELIRFAHGSTEDPLVRLSDGEFITDPELSAAIESQSIEVENGMATVTFSIAEGADPIELSLVSYTKPGPGWSRATEHLQVFVDADTETFETGGPHTLRVALPKAEVGPCETTEATTTATPTDTQTPTATAETPIPTSEPAKSIAETPAPTPTPTPTVEKTLDLRVGGDGQSLPLEFAPVQNGERYEMAVSIENTGNTPGRYLCVAVTDVAGSENGRKEPERDAGVSDRPGSELPQYLNVTIAVHHPNGGADTVYAQRSLENAGMQCVKLQEPLTDDGATLRVAVIVAEEDISNAMSDTATFDIELTLYAHGPNEE